MRGSLPFELLAGALLHDIGKFWYRAGGNKQHEELSKEFVEKHNFPGNKEIIANIVLNHHRDRLDALPQSTIKTLASIVCEADSISANMDREYDENTEAKIPLKPIFTEISLNKHRDKKYREYYKPVKLSLDSMMEALQETQQDMEAEHRALWSEFEKEFNNLPDDEDAFILKLFYLLKKYTSFVLSAGYQSVPDISLFDHLKTTAAISSALYLWRKENNWANAGDEKVYLLIEGDLSGIQRYITSVSNPQEARKGASKRMRGRSMWLNLLMDSITARIAGDLGLTEINTLWCTGGHFLMIAPNTEKTKKCVEDVRKRVNRELFEDHEGRIFLALDWYECNSESLRDFSNSLEQLSLKLDLQKKKKFLDMIPDEEEWDENPGKYCPVCGKYLKDRSNGVCSICENHERLGQNLAGAKYMIRGSTGRFFFRSTKIGYDFTDSLSPDLKGKTIYKLNSTDFEDSNGFKFIGNTVPKVEGRVLSFNEIAQMSKGAHKLGILKADVDNLGKIFLSGFERRSISKSHQLSSLMELFFAGYLNRLCERHCVYLVKNLDEKEKYTRKIEIEDEETGKKTTFYEIEKNSENPGQHIKVSKIYIIYSGGDDVLIVGPYDDIVELAQELKEDFERFSCNNPDISISAGVSIVDPHYPVARSVISTNEKLEKSKDKAGKSSITVFGETVKWKSNGEIMGFDRLLECGKELETMVEDKKISSSFIYSLFRMWNYTWDREPRDEDRLQRKRYMPYLKYQLARNFKDGSVRDHAESIIKPCMPWIKIPASWVSLRKR